MMGDIIAMLDASFAARFAATIAAGAVGALVARKAHIPAPFTTGAMVSVILLTVLTGRSYMPSLAKPIAQSIAGGAVGATIRRETLDDLKRAIRPVLAYDVSLMAVALIASAAVYRFTPLLLSTAVLSCAPGGISDMTLLAHDFGANPMQVGLLHIMRLLVAYGAFPLITRAYAARHPELDMKADIEARAAAPSSPLPMSRVVLNAVIMIGAGLIGWRLNVPAGAITFSMAAVAVYQVKTNCARMSLKARRVAQVFSGAYIGSMVTVSDLSGVPDLVLPFLIILTEFLILDFVIGPIIARRYKQDITTMLLACSPAGAAEMALIAGEMGGDQAKVALFHIVRLASVLATFPFIMSALV